MPGKKPPKGKDPYFGQALYTPDPKRPHIQKGMDTPRNRREGNVGRVKDPNPDYLSFMRKGEPVLSESSTPFHRYKAAVDTVVDTVRGVNPDSYHQKVGKLDKIIAAQNKKSKN